MKRISCGSAVLALALLSLVPDQTFAQIEKCVEAHGGLSKWQSFGTVEYDLAYQRPKGEKRDHQVFNLHTRDGLITSDAYTLGASQGEVWIKPNAEAMGGTPPRFYMWTPFYFFGMPFVFADPGVKLEALGKKEFQGQKYDAVKITFQSGHRRFAGGLLHRVCRPCFRPVEAFCLRRHLLLHPQRQSDGAARAARDYFRRMAECRRTQGSKVGRVLCLEKRDHRRRSPRPPCFQQREIRNRHTGGFALCQASRRGRRAKTVGQS